MVTRRRAGPARTVVVLVCLALLACSPPPTPAPTPDPGAEQNRRSRALLELQVTRDGGPGCIAAVGERGVVRWQSMRGYADLESATPITEATAFELASVTKQFTALAVLLLEQDGALSTRDAVSRYVSGLPSWGRRVTLAHLIHHTSGISDYFPDHTGGDPTLAVSRRSVLARIAAEQRLDFEPGARWAYSNSNYVLLAEVVERASGQTYPDFLASRVFSPLRLSMVASTGGSSPGLAHSYAPTAAGFESGAWHFYAMGAVGVRATAVDLVRWGDEFRTGTVGGRALLDAQWRDAPETGLESTRYGAGVFRLPDGTLYSDGFFGGYRSGLIVSPDREREAVLLCNRTAGIDPYDAARGLARVWEFR